MVQTITSQIFSHHGKISNELLQKLTSRGINQSKAVLKNLGWDGVTPAATVVHTIEPGTSNIKGTRWHTVGRITDAAFLGKSLWPECDPNLLVTINVDLNTVPWLMTGDHRNFSVWMQDSALKPTYKDADDSLIDYEAATLLGAGHFCLRLSIVPVSVGKGLMYASLVPFLKDELHTIVTSAGCGLQSASIPTIALSLTSVKNKPVLALPIAMLTKEGLRDKVGLGLYPLFEHIGPGEVAYPDHEVMGEELFTFLRSVKSTNNVNIGRLTELFEDTDTFSREPKNNIKTMWPMFEARTGARSVTATGACLTLISYSDD